MGAPGATTDTIYRGDTYTHTVTLKNADGSAYNGSTSTWSAKLREGEDDTAAVATMTVNTANAATGVFVVSTTAAITAGLTQRKLVWDLQETTSATSVLTWLKVTCTVTKDTSW